MRCLSVKAQTQGFTLVELLITLSVVGIIMAWAIPSMGQLFERGRVRGIGEEFGAVLSLARSEAMMSNASVYVQITAGADWCWGIRDSATACNCKAANSCTVRGQARQASVVQYSGITMNTGSFDMIFDSRGTVTATAPVEFQSGKTKGRVSISAVGRTRTCSDDLVGWLPLASC
ncbi:MAG: GspH/FimT family pseudopilin [Pseudomonadota bacterium]